VSDIELHQGAEEAAARLSQVVAAATPAIQAQSAVAGENPYDPSCSATGQAYGFYDQAAKQFGSAINQLLAALAADGREVPAAIEALRQVDAASGKYFEATSPTRGDFTRGA
jgi:hypothetical protein